jgi:hypothetical protein
MVLNFMFAGAIAETFGVMVAPPQGKRMNVI